jgi:hypothetical protein
MNLCTSVGREPEVSSGPKLFVAILAMLSLAFLVALVTVMVVPRLEMTRLLIWGLLFLAFLLGILYLDRDEPTSLWNIVCATGLISIVHIAVIVSRPILTWRGLNHGTDASIVTIKALAILVLFLISGRMGYQLGRWWARKTNRPALSLFDLRSQRQVYILIAVFGLIPIGIMVQFMLIRRFGGVQAVLTNMAQQTFSGRPTENLGLVELFANLAIGGAILLPLLVRTRLSWRCAVVIAFIVALVHMWSGRRTDILPILVSVMFSYHYRVHRIRFRYWILLAVVGYAVMTFILLGRLYYSGAYAHRMSSDPIGLFTETLNFGMGDSVEGFLQTVAEEDAFGIRPWSYKAWYSFLWYPIPRALFPGKPYYVAIGKLVKGLYVAPSPTFDFRSGVAPTIMATLYLNDGYVGFSFGMIRGGGGLGILDSRLLNRRVSDARLLHNVTWILVLILFRTGDLTAAVTQVMGLFGGLVMTTLVVGLLGQILRQRQPRSAALPPSDM